MYYRKKYEGTITNFSTKKTYRYKIVCLECGKEYLRIRRPSNIKKYRCGVCNGNLNIEILE